MDMTQNRSLLRHKGNFPGKSKNNDVNRQTYLLILINEATASKEDQDIND